MIFGDNPTRMPNAGWLPDNLAIMQAVNLYVYCVNNPVNFVDPRGLSVAGIDVGGYNFLVQTISPAPPPVPRPPNPVPLSAAANMNQVATVGNVANAIPASAARNDGLGGAYFNRAECASVPNFMGAGGVLGVGGTFTYGSGMGSSVQGAFVIDANGDVGFMLFVGSGAVSPQFSVSADAFYIWDADTIYDLGHNWGQEGETNTSGGMFSGAAGGSTAVKGLSAGGFVVFDHNDGITGAGVSVGGGIPVPFAMYGVYGVTQVWPIVNIYDARDNVLNSIDGIRDSVNTVSIDGILEAANTVSIDGILDTANTAFNSIHRSLDALSRMMPF